MKATCRSILWGALIAGCMTSNAQEQQWIRVNPESDQNMKVLLDALSIEQDGLYKKAWFKYDFAAAHQSPNKKPYRSSIQSIYFDCRTRSMAVKSMTNYANADGRGEVTNVWEPVALRFNEPPPGSMGAAHVFIVCRQQ